MDSCLRPEIFIPCWTGRICNIKILDVTPWGLYRPIGLWVLYMEPRSIESEIDFVYIESPRKPTEESIFFISLYTFKWMIIPGINCPCSKSRIILSKVIIKGPKKKSKGKGSGATVRQSLGFPDARAKGLLCQHPDLLMRTGLLHRSGLQNQTWETIHTSVFLLFQVQF